MLSSSFTMPSPCTAVHFLMGEPPPILLYCSWILGVRRLAISGANVLHQGREGCVTAQPKPPLPTALLQLPFPGSLCQLQQSSMVCLMFSSSTLPTPPSAAKREQPRHRAWHTYFQRGSSTVSCTDCSQDEAVLGSAAPHRSLQLRQQHL